MKATLILPALYIGIGNYNLYGVLAFGKEHRLFRIAIE
jgi:hypothetical protein